MFALVLLAATPASDPAVDEPTSQAVVTPASVPVYVAPLPTAPGSEGNPELIMHAVAERRYGLHLGINATLSVDARLGRYVYLEATTQLTGIGAVIDRHANWVASLMLFGGVALPILERPNLRLTFDAGVNPFFFHAQPDNDFGIGVLAGLRLVHRNGFTFAFKLPIVGYSGTPEVHRGGVLYYYIAAIPVVPLVTFGYTFR